MTRAADHAFDARERARAAPQADPALEAETLARAPFRRPRRRASRRRRARWPPLSQAEPRLCARPSREWRDRRARLVRALTAGGCAPTPRHRRWNSARRPGNGGSVKILVPVKRVSDPDNANKVKVTADGKAVTTEGLEWKPNPFDEYAVETALRLIENAAEHREARRDDRRRRSGPRTPRRRCARRSRWAPTARSTSTADDKRARLARRRARAQGDRRQGEARPRPDGQAGRRRRRATRSARCSPSSSAGRRRRSRCDRDRRRRQERSPSAARSTPACSASRCTTPAVVTVDLRIVAPEAVQERRHARRRTSTPRARATRRSRASWRRRRSRSTEQKLADLGSDAALSTNYSKFELPPARNGR